MKQIYIIVMVGILLPFISNGQVDTNTYIFGKWASINKNGDSIQIEITTDSLYNITINNQSLKSGYYNENNMDSLVNKELKHKLYIDFTTIPYKFKMKNYVGDSLISFNYGEIFFKNKCEIFIWINFGSSKIQITSNQGSTFYKENCN